MADLDPKTAAALCRALETSLGHELRRRVRCTDISQRSQRWDIEACDLKGNLVRRVSHTQTVSSPMAQAGSQLGDIRRALEAELALLGVTDHRITYYSRQLPPSRPKRQQLGKKLARRIHDHLRNGVPIIEDPLAVVLRGEHPWRDPIAKFFVSVDVMAIPGSGPARVLVSGDDRLSYRVPELEEEVLPAIAEKKKRHGTLTPQLTIVVEPTLSTITGASLRQAYANLGLAHRGFASAYVGKLIKGRQPARFVLWRLY